MHKETITYNDFDGNKRTEDTYFHLTKSEMIEFALDLPDGVSDTVDRETLEKDADQAASKLISMLGKKGIYKFIKDLVLKSYGVKKEDGRQFAKLDENGRPLYIGFSQTMAFETIMEKLRTDDIAAANFVKAVIPADTSSKMPSLMK
jgi:hypothetical protein